MASITVEVLNASPKKVAIAIDKFAPWSTDGQRSGLKIIRSGDSRGDIIQVIDPDGLEIYDRIGKEPPRTYSVRISDGNFYIVDYNEPRASFIGELTGSQIQEQINRETLSFRLRQKLHDLKGGLTWPGFLSRFKT